jgi:hypothetical protein
MDMSTLQIHLRDDLRQLAEQKAAEGGYKTVVEYVEAIIEAGISEDDLEIDDELETLILQRLDDPTKIELTPEYRKQLAEELAKSVVASER